MTKEAILVFDNAKWLDENRSTFYKTLNERYQVVSISAPSFLIGPETPEIVDEIIIREIEYLISKNIHIVMGLSINGTGITQRTADYFDSNDIPFHIWYWDTPFGGDEDFDKYAFKDHYFIYHACQDWNYYFEKRNVKSSFLPFAASPYIKNDALPEKNILFLGALWHMNQISTNLSAGLRKNNSEKIYHSHELLKEIRSEDFIDNIWTTRSGKKIVNLHVLSALSANKRAQYLSLIQDHGLDIYGDLDWQFNLWDAAPELFDSYINQTIHDQNKVKELMQNYKLTINIFHVQNENGGPNMRILQCANFGLPIFSDWNKHCEEIYPHGQAGYYFKSKSECIMYTEELLKNDEFRKKLVENAGEILNNGHTHKHRIETFLNNSGLNTNHTNKENIIFKHFDASPTDNKKTKKKDVMKTPQAEVQNYWSDYIDNPSMKYEGILQFIRNSNEFKKLINVLKTLVFRVLKLILIKRHIRSKFLRILALIAIYLIHNAILYLFIMTMI